MSGWWWCETLGLEPVEVPMLMIAGLGLKVTFRGDFLSGSGGLGAWRRGVLSVAVDAIATQVLDYYDS